MFVSIPDERITSIYIKCGTTFSEIVNHPKFSKYDSNEFFLKSNSPIKLISEEHRLATIYLCPRLRGGSSPEEEREQMLKDLQKKDEENTALMEKVKQLEILLQKMNLEVEEGEDVIEFSLSEEDEIETTKTFSHSYEKSPIKKTITPKNVKMVKKTVKSPKKGVEATIGKDKSIKPATCKGLNKYDGQQDWDEWIKSFNLFAMSGKWSEDLKISTFVDYLSNDIRLVLSNLVPEDFEDFNKLSHAVYDLFDKKRKSTVDYMSQLLNSTMKTTNSINVAQWYTKIVNLANLARVKDYQNNYQVKVVLIEGVRPARLYEKVIDVFDIDDKDLLDGLTLDQIYKTILQKEKLYEKVKKVESENAKNPNPNPNPNPKNTNTPNPNPNPNKKGETPTTKKEYFVDSKKDPLPDKPIDKKLLALSCDELKEQNRCFFCTKKLGDHLPSTCRNAYKGMKADDVRQTFLDGKTPTIKNDLTKPSGKTPKNTQVGLGDSQKK